MRNYLKTLTTRESGRQMLRLAVIGLINTANYFILFNLLRINDVSLFWSVTIAYGAATFVSYVLNRRWTFGLSSSAGGVAETAKFYVVNLVAWGVTLLIVLGADALFGPLGIIGENLASIVAALVVLVPRFASYRDVVFRRALRAEGRHHSAPSEPADPASQRQS